MKLCMAPWCGYMTAVDREGGVRACTRCGYRRKIPVSWWDRPRDNDLEGADTASTGAVKPRLRAEHQ